MTTEIQVIPLSKLSEELSAQDALTAVAVAMEELCIIQALEIIHGRDRGVEMYVERGGHVRFNDEGEPVLLWTPGLAARSTEAQASGGQP